jgi:hypothetical protein
MISGVTSLPIPTLFFPVYIGGGRIQKDQIQLPVEQVSIPKIKLPFQIVPNLMQKPGRAVQMLQFQELRSCAFQGPEPMAALQITAGLTEALQRQRKNRPLQGKMKLSPPGQTYKDLRHLLLFPKPAEDQRWPPNLGLAVRNPGISGGRDDL